MNPDSVQLSLAGKTFVAGEYLALLGGPALVLATDPRFCLSVQKNSNSIDLNPFHPNSPAGKLWLKNQKVLSHFQFKFTDPYGRGGFGASSAQFALLHAVLQFQNNLWTESERNLDLKWMLQNYRELAATESFPPSGADIVGAVSGGFTFFERNTSRRQTYSWPFVEIEFLVAHTGVKLATHEHLKTLSQFDAQPFELAMKQIEAAFLEVNQNEFIAGLQNYQKNLHKNGWIADSTTAKLKALKVEAGEILLFAKGCGAMGSDVIFMMCMKSDTNILREILQRHSLKVFADSSIVSQGIQIRSPIGNLCKVEAFL